VTELASSAQRVESLLQELGAEDARVATRAEELVRALSEMYGEGLGRLVRRLDEELVREAAQDELVGGLLVLHDLHPDDLPTRVQAALDRVRPGLGAHAGDVELLGLAEAEDGVVVQLRLAGSCQGCPSSEVTVHQAIERAVLAAAPEVVRLDVEGTERSEPPLLQIQPRPIYAADGSECPAVVGAAG
jgi:Fe-S cluster biogenesis protein NfuA